MVDRDNKGNRFEGLMGGKHYKRLAALMGMGPSYYRRCVEGIQLDEGMKALDLGCGPGALSFALAENAHPKAAVIGIDISNDQLDFARKHCESFQCSIEFNLHSMDELPYPDESFDFVVSSMALHETPPSVRRGAVAEAARVLKPKGLFVYVDWSKPKFGLWGIVWLPFTCWGEKNKDNWNNAYLEICQKQGFERIEDVYLTSIARRQTFRKTEKNS